MLGLLLLLVGAVSGQDIIGAEAGYCGCTSCLEVNNDTYYGVAEDQGGRCWAGQVQGCLMIKGNDEICVCHAPINVNGGTTAFANSCKGPVPKTARMSSIYELELEFGIAFPATNCIDGHTNRWPDGHTNSMCHTQDEHAPWLALEFDSPVDVKSATIYNREDCCGGRFSNAEVRVTDTLPTDGTEMFTGGQLLGSFKGPGTDGQVIHIQGEEYLRGRFVLIQQQGTALNLLEVTVEAKLVQGCISSPKDFKAELEGILTGGPRRRYVCDGQLMSHMVPIMDPPSRTLAKNGNAWAWTSGWPVLNHFLDLASSACTRAHPRFLKPKTCRGGQSARTKLIQDMLHYVGFGDEDFNLNNSWAMAVFETARAQAAWDYKPFQPTTTNLYTYLGQSGGFQVCNGSQPIDCTRMHMPEGFMDTFLVMNGSNYTSITNCDVGGVTVEEGCNPAYVAMIDEFKPYEYYNQDCYGCSKNCVKFYNEKFDQKTDKVLWTRAFFLSCFDVNPYNTGDGFGYDPVAKKETGPEWLIRGDDGVPLTGDAAKSMKAQYITVYEAPPCLGCVKPVPTLSASDKRLVDWAMIQLSGSTGCKKTMTKVKNFTSQVVAGILFTFDLVLETSADGCKTPGVTEECHMVVWEQSWADFREVQWDKTTCSKE